MRPGIESALGAFLDPLLLLLPRKTSGSVMEHTAPPLHGHNPSLSPPLFLHCGLPALALDSFRYTRHPVILLKERFFFLKEHNLNGQYPAFDFCQLKIKPQLPEPCDHTPAFSYLVTHHPPSFTEPGACPCLGVLILAAPSACSALLLNSTWMPLFPPSILNITSLFSNPELPWLFPLTVSFLIFPL